MKSQRLVEAVAQLSNVATEDFAVDGLLGRLCEVAAEAMPVDGAGVMSSDGSLARFVHSDSQLVRRVEQLQEKLRQGPCRDAILSCATVVSSDLAAEHRWPDLTPAALTDGLRAVVAVPLVSRGRAWGTLDLYRRQPGAWSDDELAASELLADLAVSYLVMAADRDVARQAEHELMHRSTHDQLTGLPNRGLFFDRLEHALATAHRRNDVVQVLFIDLDRFKDINDTLGHAAGDVVLVEVAARMAQVLREGDTLARLSGDEFVLLCENLPRSSSTAIDASIDRLTERLRTALSQPVHVEGVDLVVSASIGVAVTSDGPSAEDLIRDADTAMYAAKQRGRNRVVVRDHAFGAAVEYDRRLERDLVDALDHDQLRLHYQPIVSATEPDRVVAVEALLRWDHPEHGLLPASAFIKLAEVTGSLPPIGSWVIDQACDQLHRWQQGLGNSAPKTVFCNVSPRELTDPALSEVIAAAVAAHDLQPAQLGLEIVEKGFSDPLVAPLLDTYRQRGHPLSVDDFGTGYSSLSRLVQLPVDYAKIDLSFVAGLPQDPRSRALVDAVVGVAQNLDLRVVGEGVENRAQIEHLTAAGCHLLQGSYFGAPLDADRLTAELSVGSQRH